MASDVWQDWFESRRLPSFGAARRLFGAVSTDPAAAPASSCESPAIEGYVIDRILGRGGGGTVYHAHRECTGREVAIKLLNKGLGDGDASRRAWRELHVLSELRLPCLPAVHDFGEHQGRLFIVTDHIDGLNLVAYCDERGMDRRQRVELLAKVATAVQSLHEFGVIHRDIKPENILINCHGQPIIIDLGIAALLTSDVIQTITADGAPIGSPAFMSSEQACGERGQISTRSDVYSLGATAYLLLAGEPPHDMRATLHEAVRRVAQDEPRSPRSIDATMPSDLSAVLAKAAARRPDDRYPTAAALAADLRRWAAGVAVEARPPRGWRWLRMTARMHPTATSLVVLFLLGVGTAIPFVVGWIAHLKDPIVIRLDSNEPRQGFVIKGDKAPSRFGSGGVTACDFNGDGYIDIITGVPERPNMAREVHIPNAGAVFIRFGHPDDRDGARIDSITVGYDSGMLIEGPYADARLGFAIGRIGDVNLDGVDDLAFYAFEERAVQSNENEGDARAYVVFGQRDYRAGRRLLLDTLVADEGRVITGFYCDQRTNLVHALGDLDADGVDDFALCAPVTKGGERHQAGSVHILSGHAVMADTGEFVIGGASALTIIRHDGDNEDSRFAITLDVIDDVNDDGRRDLAISAPGNRQYGRNAGVVYIIYTTDHVHNGTLSLAPGDFTARDGLVILGAEHEDWLGWSFDQVGDVDGDGLEDLLIGNYQVANPVSDAGQCVLLFGDYLRSAPPLVDLSLLRPSEGVVFAAQPQPQGFGDHLGVMVSAAGDVNADGLADFAMHAVRAPDLTSGARSGVVYLVLGSPILRRLEVVHLASTGTPYGITIFGEYGGSSAGSVLAPAGDVNGDGFADLLVGAPGSNADGITMAGQVHVFFGSRRLRP